MDSECRDQTKYISLVVIVLLFLSTMFASIEIFVESAILSKWYALIAGTMVCSMLMIIDKKSIITCDRQSLCLSIFIGYLLIWGLFSAITAIQVLLLVSFLIMYFFLKSCELREVHISIMIVAACLLQALYGILQYSKVFPASGVHEILGSFDNPAGFAACLSAGYPFCFSLGRTPRLKYAGAVCAAIIAFAVILSESRAGIIAIILTATIYLYTRLKNQKSKIIYIISLLMMFLLVSITLFCYKKNSAIGRVLIWKSSIEMVENRPIFGHGAGAFSAQYMGYQADYFLNKPDDSSAQLADNVSHPFNEYLLLTIEYGLVGLLILFIAISTIFESQKVTTPILSIISITILACFSYPLRYSFVILVLAYSFSCLRSVRLYHIKSSMIIRSISLAVVCLGAIYFAKDIGFEYRWGKLVQQIHLGKHGRAKDHYKKLYEKWNGDIFFLYNYGAYLNRIGDYQKSNIVMEKCAKHFNDYDVQLIFASNYEGMNNWNQAEKHYTIASNMIPCRFIPLYRLFKIYEQNGQIDKATNQAKIILDKPIKIPSGEVYRIKSVAKEFLRDKQ